MTVLSRFIGGDAVTIADPKEAETLRQWVCAALRLRVHLWPLVGHLGRPESYCTLDIQDIAGEERIVPLVPQVG